ncbi:enoyl-CoA hydratase/isomerase [Glaciimonas sp. GNP009]
MNYQTIQVSVEQSVCFIRLHRPESNNTINRTMVDECRHALAGHNGGDPFHVVVMEGLPTVFCLGADFDDLSGTGFCTGDAVEPEDLYDLWEQLARGPFISIAHVRGKVNAGGIGFVAASDIVLIDQSVEFSLSELLFDLFPACVLPFLIRRIGFQKAHYMTLMTKSIGVQQALEWGLADAVESDSHSLLRKHLLRLRRLSKTGIQRYKTYANTLDAFLTQSKTVAVDANRALFSNAKNLEKITRYTQTGMFPWED